MRLLARVASLARNLFRTSHVERELDEEMRAYVDLLADEKATRGMSREDAGRAARMEATPELVKEQVRDVRAGALLEQFVADLRYGLRVLRRSPGFACVAVATLALGIGATTAIFSVVYGVLLRPLPYDAPDRIVQVFEVSAEGTRMQFADPNFEDLRAQNHSLQLLAEFSPWVTPVSGGSQPTRTLVAFVSRDFLPILRVQPVLGRAFAVDDHRFGAAPVALVSDRYWREYLNRERDLAALKLRIEDQAVSVVGVLPAGFAFPDRSDIWVPRELLERYPSRTAHNWQVLGRLRDGVSLARARVDLSSMAARLKTEYGKSTMMVDAAAVPLQEYLTGRTRPALLVLLGAVGFLLLIACANVVNLMFAQAAGRNREIAIRAALGAGRRRLLRQFLTESLLLALVGGALGALAAAWGVRALLAIAPSDLPRLAEVGVSVPVFLFAFGVSVAVACLLGVVTAVLGVARDLRQPLAEGGRGGVVRVRTAGRVVIASQIAITLVLLVGAGLLGRSLLSVLSVDPGFRTEHVVTMDLALPPVEGAAGSVRRVAFLDELFARLRLIPGVREVGGTNGLPLSRDGLSDGTYVLMSSRDAAPRDIAEFERLAHDTARTGDADYGVASEEYFRVLGIPVLRGRPFDDRDGLDAPHAALISQSLAREKFAGQDPLGRQIEFGNMDGDLRLLTIVGVVGDVRAGSLETPPRPTIYVNYRQRPRATGRFTVVMRADSAPGAVIPAARRLVRALDPAIPPDFSTFSEVFSASLATRRFNLTLIALFACTALLLAAAGVYGVMAYSVARRSREFGLRMALGASAGTVRRMVLGQGIAPVAIGVGAGVLGSLALTRAIASLLFGIASTDPLTFVSVVGLMAGVALVAAYVPARRATRVDPMVTLRCE